MRNYGTNKGWDRAFYAARFDEPPCATAFTIGENGFVIMPPVGDPAKLEALGRAIVDRIKRPQLGPREHR